jgi:hypothetical protein
VTRAKSAFDRWDLDPLASPEAITARLRELAEDATDPEERKAIRAAWEELTMSPLRRLEAVLDSFPETRAPAGEPPPPAASSPRDGSDIALADVIARPRVADALAPADSAERAILGSQRPR